MLKSSLALAAIVVALSSICHASEPARPVRADRLELLAKRIEPLKPAQLNMYNWRPRSARPASPGTIGAAPRPDDDAYCAGGHATQVFAAEGFRWAEDGKSGVAFGGLTDMDACAAFFGISKADAEWLFSPQSGHDPKSVAASIRKVAARSLARESLANAAIIASVR